MEPNKQTCNRKERDRVRESRCGARRGSDSREMALPSLPVFVSRVSESPEQVEKQAICEK